MLLEVKDLEISYGHNVTVSGVNFTLEKGEILAIVGESGSGKTTVIRAIQGCLPGAGRISGGQVFFKGKDLATASTKEMRELAGVGFSMIFQDSGSAINPIRTIGSQYIDYIRRHAPELSKQDAYNKACEMLRNMRLPNVEAIMGQYSFELSGGMRQRVGIAFGMTFKPDILMGDEPTSALDVTTQAQIIRQMMEVRDEYGVSIIIVTHNLGVASYMADKLMVMQRGKVVEYGYRKDVIGNPQAEYTKSLLAAVPTMEGKRYV